MRRRHVESWVLMKEMAREVALDDSSILSPCLKIGGRGVRSTLLYLHVFWQRTSPYPHSYPPANSLRTIQLASIVR